MISTALNNFRNPRFWIHFDPPRNLHSPDWHHVWTGDATTKIIPSTQRAVRDGCNVLSVPYVRDNSIERNRNPFDRRLPIVGYQHMTLSIIFATQVLVLAGYTTLVYCGVDLRARGSVSYAHRPHPGFGTPKQHNQRLNRELNTWRTIVPEAQSQNVRMLCYTPGSPLERIMDAYDPARDARRDADADSSAHEGDRGDAALLRPLEAVP